jgi:hypothetical protein
MDYEFRKAAISLLYLQRAWLVSSNVAPFPTAKPTEPSLTFTRDIVLINRDLLRPGPGRCKLGGSYYAARLAAAAVSSNVPSVERHTWTLPVVVGGSENSNPW